MKKQKTVGRPLDGSEKKKSYNVYLEPKEKQELVDNYGSLTNAVRLKRKKIKK